MLEQEYEDDSLNCPCIVLLGDSEVGKSSLYSNFFERKFCKEYIGTVEEKYVQEVKVGNAMKKNTYLGYIRRCRLL